MSAALPGAERARVERSKVVGYLLDPARSRGKAEFFLRFGFTPERWQEMADALARHGQTGKLVAVVESEYGVRYSVDGPLAAPNGKAPRVRSVWIVEHGKDFPRLITAHPI